MADEPGEVEEPGAKIWAGVSLVQFMPMSDRQRAAVDAEIERERLREEAAAEAAEQRKVEAAAERSWWMQQHGAEPVTVAEVLARHADPVKADGTPVTRKDGTPITRDPQDSKTYQGVRLDDPARPPYTALLREAKTKREEAQAAAEVAPVSEAALGRKIQSLKDLIGNTFGKRVP